MATDARETILRSIREALGSDARPLLPPAFLIEEAASTVDALAERFCAELRALGGEAFVVADASSCARAIETYVRARGVESIAVQSSPLARAIGDALQDVKVSPASEQLADELERCDCSLLEARALFADTGSALLLDSSYEDRLLPYLQRTCIIVSPMSRLRATLATGALDAIESASREQQRGEAVIVTGPSRTADIEKALVLGAHGPANLAVFLIM